MRCVPAFLLVLSVLSACDSGPRGLRPTPAGTGPRVRFDMAARPLPEMPLPTDLATRPDPTSPTGRRLNVTLQATTRAESRLRAKLDTLDGFGIFSPIWVSFDAPLNLETIRDRHAKNRDYHDDAVLLVNVDRKSPGFGTTIPLDAGQGNFPLGLEWPWQYWDFDEHADSVNLVFETHDEDTNHNGKLDPYEDIDFDGVLDRPNTWSGKDPGTSSPDDLITFYEKQTDTLFLWPVAALDPKTTYAVVLTRDLVGVDGQPVRSPFEYVNAADQTPALEPLAEVLGRPDIGKTLDDVAFAWTFTTQSITDELEAIRAGLYGHGSLARLANDYPPDLAPKIVRDPNYAGILPEKPYILPIDQLGPLFELIGPVLNYPAEVVQALKKDTQYLDYFVLGTFTSPNFLVDKDGMATPMYPAEDDESFDIDLATGNARHGPTTVSFVCAIPKATAERKPPFPVITYGHGYSGAPFEIFGFAGRLARWGYALCGHDAPGHGLALPADEDIPYDQIIPQMLSGLGLETFYNNFKGGRIRDLDNDGLITSFDNGGDFWSWDVFHMRDMVRQTVVDQMQWIRVLRALGTRQWSADTNGDGSPDRMGDFDGDGVVDIGTSANQAYPVWGQSMGAIVAEVLAGVEATVNAATPISGGGGLIHVGLRSTNPGVPEAVLMPMMGPFIVFTPKEDGQVELAQMINHLHRENRPLQPNRPHYYPFARTKDLKPGDAVVVRNKANGTEVRAFRHPDGRGFRVSLPCDALSATEKRPVLGLRDGDMAPVPVSCKPGTWTVNKDADGKPTGPATCPDPQPGRSLMFGDALEIEIHDGFDGPVKKRIDTFEMDLTYEGSVFPAGSPLVAIGTGFGKARNTPDFRRLMGIAAMIVERGDPIGYASHYRKEGRLDFSYDPVPFDQANVIIYHTIGDPNTPIATSLSLARTAGVLDFLPGKDGAKSRNDRLLEAYVAEGVEGFWRHTSTRWKLKDWATNEKLLDKRWLTEFTELAKTDPDRPMPLHADPDNLDNGTDEFGEPDLDPPVRATMCNASGCIALRMPYTFPLGAHGVEPSNPSREFDINNFVENQIAVFFASGGKKLTDDPCLATASCDFLPASFQTDK